MSGNENEPWPVITHITPPPQAAWSPCSCPSLWVLNIFLFLSFSLIFLNLGQQAVVEMHGKILPQELPWPDAPNNLNWVLLMKRNRTLPPTPELKLSPATLRRKPISSSSLSYQQDLTSVWFKANNPPFLTASELEFTLSFKQAGGHSTRWHESLK